jgi:signal transduction histidine kinase
MSVSVDRRAEPSQTRGRPVETSSFKWFASAVITLNLGLLLLAASATQGRLSRPWPEWLGWVLLVSLAGLVPLRSGRGPAFAMDLPLLLGAAFVFDPFAAGLIAFLGAIDIRELRREVSVVRAAWNRSQTSLSVMAASATFSALGGLGDWPRTPLVALAGLASDALVNYLIVAAGSSLRTGASFRDSLWSMKFGSPSSFLLTYACFGFVGVLIAEAEVRFGFVGVLASVAPVVLGRQAFLHRSRLDRAEKTIAASAEALRHVDQRIAQERRDERARIAEALHDEVLQDLYNVTIRAQVLRQDLLSGRLLALEDDLPAVVRAAEAAVEDLREVIKGLQSATIGHAGLVETLSLFARHLESDHSARIVLSLDPSVRSTPEKELISYQIGREALTNALRHSGARTIWLTLQAGADTCTLTVEDDGCGFDVDQPSTGLHFGLQLMRERANSIAGDLRISSSPGIGSTVRLEFHP